MMWWLLTILIQIVACTLVIFAGHSLYVYVQNNLTKKVVKNMYHTQVEKYQGIVEELQQELSNKMNMETELEQFLAESIEKRVSEDNKDDH